MKRSLVAALVAVVLAVIGCVSVLFYVSGAESRALTGKDPVKVVIAAKTIPSGTSGATIRNGGYVKTVAMPRSSVPADAMSELDPSLDELVVTSDIQPSQLLLRGAFGEPGNNTVALPEGKMAVTFAAHCVGTVQAGSKIAVFDTYGSVDGGQTRLSVDPKEDKVIVPASKIDQFQWVTRLLVAKLDVMAVSASESQQQGSKQKDGAADAKEGERAGQIALEAPCDGDEIGSGATGGALVTVAVTQAEAERLILASHIGILSVAIVNDETEVAPGPGTNEQRMYPNS